MYGIEDIEAPLDSEGPPIEPQPSTSHMEMPLDEPWVEEEFVTPSTSASEADSEDVEIISDSTPRRGIKRKRVSAAQKAIIKFTDIAEESNRKVGGLDQRMEQLIEEKKNQFIVERFD